MFLWFIGVGVALLWWVLRDPQLDYRFVALGSVLADPLDAVWGGAGPAHSIVVVGVVMAVVLVWTRRSTARRRVLIACVFGLGLHVLLDFVWANSDVFWWPLRGSDLPTARPPVVSRGIAVGLVLELLGAVALYLWARGVGLRSRADAVDYLRRGPRS